MGCCGKPRRINQAPTRPVSIGRLPTGNSKLANGRTDVCTKCGSKMVLKQQYKVSGRTYQQWRCQGCNNLRGIYS